LAQLSRIFYSRTSENSSSETKWHFAGAAYVRALLEAGQEDLMEEAGVVKVPCDNCGYLALFDAETLGVRGLWAEGREL
jgi:hypothetical protein